MPSSSHGKMCHEIHLLHGVSLGALSLSLSLSRNATGDGVLTSKVLAPEILPSSPHPSGSRGATLPPWTIRTLHESVPWALKLGAVIFYSVTLIRNIPITLTSTLFLPWSQSHQQFSSLSHGHRQLVLVGHRLF